MTGNQVTTEIKRVHCARKKCKWSFRLDPSKPTRRYHSVQCATAERVARHRDKKHGDLADAGSVVVATETVCKHCQNTFLSVSSSQRGGFQPTEHCSRKCRVEARKIAKSLAD